MDSNAGMASLASSGGHVLLTLPVLRRIGRRRLLRPRTETGAAGRKGVSCCRQHQRHAVNGQQHRPLPNVKPQRRQSASSTLADRRGPPAAEREQPKAAEALQHVAIGVDRPLPNVNSQRRQQAPPGTWRSAWTARCRT